MRCKARFIRKNTRLSSKTSVCFFVVPKAGLEPARTLIRLILSQVRLPFRHSGMFFWRIKNITHSNYFRKRFV